MLQHIATRAGLILVLFFVGSSVCLAAEEAVFGIQNIYLKSVTLNSPAGAEGFLIKEVARMETTDVKVDSRPLGADQYEVVLSMKLKVFRGKTIVLEAEGHQAGIFTIKNVQSKLMQPILKISCANILYPYLRETITNMATKAGAPPFYLEPVNFEVMHGVGNALPAKKIKF